MTLTVFIFFCFFGFFFFQMFGMEAAPKFAPSPKNGTTSSPTRRATSGTSDANLLGESDDFGSASYGGTTGGWDDDDEDDLDNLFD
jgi:hypothetical protein